MPINGTSGSDTLTGTSGNDIFNGMGGNDDLTGDAGSDLYNFSQTFGNDVVREGGANGNNTDIINVGGLNITGNAIAYNGTYLYGDVVITQPNTGGLLLTRGSDSILLEEWDSNGDYGINLTPLPSGSAVYGTSGNDNIGTAATDSFGNPINPNLGSGTQHYYGLDGNDTAFGEGFDVLFGGNGNDMLTAASGSLIIFGENDNDQLMVGGGNHTVYGGAGDDLLYVYSNLGGNSFLSGGAGNDLLGFYYHSSYSTYNIGNNVFLGGAGDDVFLDPYSRNDTLNGGVGNDLYIFYTSNSLSHGNDIIVDEDGQGTLAYRIYSPTTTVVGSYTYTDTINGTATQVGANQWELVVNDGTFTLSFSGDDLVLTSTINGGQSITIRNFLDGQYGITLDVSNPPTTVTGTAGDDTLNGTAGADTIDGLGGNDILNGLGDNDSLIGGTDNDSIDGGTGNDTMVGGAGNDSYFVDAAGDVVTEGAAAGTDSVTSSVTYTLGANLENLAITGSANIHAIGNLLDNVLVGNSGVNSVIGGAGNDSIDGGLGDDNLTGGEGADTIVGGGGWDGAHYANSAAGVAVDLGLATAQVSGGDASGDVLVNIDRVYGSAFSDVLTGNANANWIRGMDGNDTLDGAAGVDSLLGGLGNDVYFIDSSDIVTENASEGTDTINASFTYTLGSNLENLVLTGSSNINGTGNTLNNVLAGNSGTNSLSGGDGNDTLDGGTGVDTLVGGLGNDVYTIDASDTVTENASEGTDTINASFTYTLGANFENLILTGGANINATGNALANVLTGNSGNNALDGGAGNDTLVGGTGNDVYYVDSAGDVITENAAEGTDAINSSVSYTLGSNVENLVLTGSSNINATGNTVANIITGNSGNNSISGGDGDDTLDGGAGGTDTVVGGNGTDLVSFASSGSGVLVSMATSSYGGDSVSGIEGILGSNFSDTITGDSSGNVLNGNAGDDYLVGGAGADTLDGGAGTYDTADYTYSASAVNINLATNVNTGGDAAGDVISNCEYIYGSNYADTITGDATATYLRGFDGTDVISAGAGNDRVDGGIGADTMDGGADTDTVDYYYSSAAVNVDLSSGSAQSGGWAQGDVLSNIENVWGSNSYADAITGSGGSNVLYGFGGNDTLIGGAGNDTLIGGAGDDSFQFATGSGVDNVSAFDGAGAAGGDVLRIANNVNGSGIVDWTTLSANISYAGGNAIIDLGSGHTITLVGVTSLIASDVVIY